MSRTADSRTGWDELRKNSRFPGLSMRVGPNQLSLPCNMPFYGCFILLFRIAGVQFKSVIESYDFEVVMVLLSSRGHWSIVA